MKKISIVLLVVCVGLLILTVHRMNQNFNTVVETLNSTTDGYSRVVKQNKEFKEYFNDLNLTISEKNEKITELENEISNLKLKIKELEIEESKRKEKRSTVNRGSRIMSFKATAYDLSVNSCGKPVGSKGYGITANGTNLTGKTRQQAMTVAVDPEIIKLGSKLKITFPEPYEHFTGVYTANDTGGAIKGNKIDIFMGDFKSNKTHQSVWDFGVRDVKVEIIK